MRTVHDAIMSDWGIISRLDADRRMAERHRQGLRQREALEASRSYRETHRWRSPAPVVVDLSEGRRS